MRRSEELVTAVVVFFLAAPYSGAADPVAPATSVSPPAQSSSAPSSPAQDAATALSAPVSPVTATPAAGLSTPVSSTATPEAGLSTPANSSMAPAKSPSTSSTSTVPASPEKPAADKQVTELEVRFFSHDFAADPIDERIGRLEKFIFGDVGAGTCDARLAKLKKSLHQEQPVSGETAGKPADKSLLEIINEGIDNYNKHRFHNAEDSFRQATAMAPGMSRVHAYLACTLLQINQRQSAMEEFRFAYEIDPFGAYGRYAKNALITLAGDEAIRESGPVDSKKLFNSSLDKINKQAQSVRTLNDQIYARSFSDRASTARGTEERLRAEYSGNDLAVERTNASLFASSNMYKVQHEAQKRTLLTQESANNLKSLMTTKNRPGDAKLRAFGTTLNTRYYGNETYNLAPYYIPREKPAELHALSAAIQALKAPIKRPLAKTAVARHPAVKNKSSKRR